MGVAQGLEEDELMLAGHHDAADLRAVAKQVVVERDAVVLVVDFELRCRVETACEHVRPGPLQPDQVNGGGAPRESWMRSPPTPLRRRHLHPRQRVELILFDDPRPTLGSDPPQMAAQPARDPPDRAFVLWSPIEERLGARG